METDVGGVPTGWEGEAVGVLAMAEDTRTRFFHPKGFHYYSFYRVWLMPAGWEGVMKHTPYVSDSVPAYLLGANDDYVAFYHTAGGNVWPEGPEMLCGVLGLERICYSDLTRRVVDLEVEERLTATGPEANFVFNPRRIMGLAADGPNLYLEYIFPSREGEDETQLLATMTDRLANSVFALIPEAESLYLRRCTSDTYTDTHRESQLGDHPHRAAGESRYPDGTPIPRLPRRDAHGAESHDTPRTSHHLPRRTAVSRG